MEYRVEYRLQTLLGVWRSVTVEAPFVTANLTGLYPNALHQVSAEMLMIQSCDTPICRCGLYQSLFLVTVMPQWL